MSVAAPPKGRPERFRPALSGTLTRTSGIAFTKKGVDVISQPAGTPSLSQASRAAM